MFLYSYRGFEWVTTSAEEVRAPELVPKGMLISVVVLFVSCALATEGMIHLLGQSELKNAYPQLFLGRHAAGEFGYVLMRVITALTALNTFNGGFITASRSIYATAREGSLPSGFARLNVNFVPWVPVVALAATSLVVGVIVALTDSWQVLVAVGAALEAMIYVVAGFCMIQLRNREPDRVRPFRLRAGQALGVGRDGGLRGSGRWGQRQRQQPVRPSTAWDRRGHGHAVSRLRPRVPAQAASSQRGTGRRGQQTPRPPSTPPVG